MYLLVCIWLLFAFIDNGQTHFVVCPTKLIFHIPCPGCGLTRATVLFLHGQWLDALMLNPNVLFSIAFCILCPALLVFDAVSRKQWTLKAFQTFNKALKNLWVLIPFIIFETTVWIHNIICHI